MYKKFTMKNRFSERHFVPYFHTLSCIKFTLGCLNNVTRLKMVFLTNEFTKKAEITILSARESTRPGLQAGALWVERKAYITESVARDSHLGL